jgi:hypothetical protein
MQTRNKIYFTASVVDSAYTDSRCDIMRDFSTRSRSEVSRRSAAFALRKELSGKQRLFTASVYCNFTIHGGIGWQTKIRHVGVRQGRDDS